MVTIGDERAVCGRHQNKVFLSRDDAVKILVVIFVH